MNGFAWTQLKECLIGQLDALYGSPYEKDICFSLNIFNDGKRVRTSSIDRVKKDDWKIWKENIDWANLIQDPFFRDFHHVDLNINDIQLDVLNKE